VTLLEAVAGLALMGSLVAGLLLTASALSRQRRVVERRLLAVEACDQLLSNWRAEDRPLLSNGTGPIGEDGLLTWSTRIMNHQSIGGQPVDVIRLEVSDGDQALVSVELLNEPQSKQKGVHAR
jgi:type II secretory pathway pseudopilin PulG